jgi:putative ABC transport system permease protein
VGLPVQTRWTNVDHAYFQTFGIRFVEGRPFSDALATDVGRTAVINETARRAFGWETAVGKTIRWRTDGEPIEVIGVVADFHYQSLQQAIEPLVHFFPGPDADQYSLVAVQFSPGPVQPVLDLVDAQLRTLDPSRTVDYFFADDHFDRLYQEVERSGQLVGAFALLAVVIGCLGLLGLASFAATQRTKEIGVRKVMGASAGQLVWLLSRSFARLVLVAFAQAAPLAYLAAGRWLDGFAYRIGLSWTIFAAAGLLLLGIALLTVSYQALRAATADPVKALRYE